MIVADQPNRRSAKLVIVDADGGMRHLPRREIGSLFNPGDLVVANDAATLPASLHGSHSASGEPIEVRLAGVGFGRRSDPICRDRVRRR